MKPLFHSLTFLLIIFVSTVTACLWDTDTLNEEMSASPTAIELVTGAFPRHSETFYRWRIKDRTAKLEQGNDDPLHYDDIAVAHDKLHEQDKAIEWMKRKEEKYPGNYETYANLGTFHIHSGNFLEGIRYIEKALNLNSAAHFNREQYQLYVVRYLQYRTQHGQFKDGKLLLPLSRDPYLEKRNPRPRNHGGEVGEVEEVREKGINSFYSFIAIDLADKTAEQYNPEHVQMSEEETAKAVQGILGMMRFGHHDSPILLECLADLLVPDPSHGVGNRIAARALLKASYEVEDETAREMYYEKACHAIFYQKEVEITPLKEAFERELSQAGEYHADLENLEKSWIESGEDVEAKFRAKFYPRSKEDGNLAYFPVEFEQISRTSPLTEVSPAYRIFILLASLLLSISIAGHLLPKILRFRQGNS